MKFTLFGFREALHLRKSRDFLREAQLARLEHEMAAEHHGALARMYRERVVRLERELADAMAGRPLAPHPAKLEEQPVLQDTDSVVYPVYPGKRVQQG